MGGMLLIQLITVKSKLTRMAIRARDYCEWERSFLWLGITNFGWVRFRLDSSPRQHCNCTADVATALQRHSTADVATALQLFHRVASVGKAPDTHAKKARTRN